MLAISIPIAAMLALNFIRHVLRMHGCTERFFEFTDTMTIFTYVNNVNHAGFKKLYVIKSRKAKEQHYAIDTLYYYNVKHKPSSTAYKITYDIYHAV